MHKIYNVYSFKVLKTTVLPELKYVSIVSVSQPEVKCILASKYIGYYNEWVTSWHYIKNCVCSDLQIYLAHTVVNAGIDFSF